MQFLKTLLTIVAMLTASVCFGVGDATSSQLQQKVVSHNKFILNGKLDNNSSKEFLPELIASEQDSQLDMWFKMPQGATANLSSIKKARLGEQFSLFPLIRNASIKDGKFKLKYSISASAPDGKVLDIVKDATFQGEKKSSHDVIICPDIIDIKFDKRYQSGKYSFSISATDEIANKTVSNSTFVEIVKWQAPAPIKDARQLDEAFKNFHLKPSAELLYSMFFSKELDIEQKQSPYRINFIIMGFFKTAFKKYDFLIDEIKENFDKFDNLDKSKIILLSRFLNNFEIPDAKLNQTQKKYKDALKRAEIPNAYEIWHRLLAPTQIDLLWGEFYASGAYKPIRRMMNLFANEAEGKDVKRMIAQKKRPSDEAQWNKFTIGMLHLVSVKSILRNAQDCDLVDQYCVWAYENKDLPEESMRFAKKYFDLSQPHSQFKEAFNSISF